MSLGVPGKSPLTGIDGGSGKTNPSHLYNDSSNYIIHRCKDGSVLFVLKQWYTFGWHDFIILGKFSGKTSKKPESFGHFLGGTKIPPKKNHKPF